MSKPIIILRKMNRHFFFFFFAMAALASGCSTQPPLAGTITIQADAEWKPMVYLIDPGRWDAVARSFAGTVIDSAAIAESGHFSFGKMPAVEGTILLELAVQRNALPFFANRLEESDPASANYCPIIWEPGKKLRVHAEAAAFQKTFSLENPSAENAALLQLRDLRLQAYSHSFSNLSPDVHAAEVLMDHAAALTAYQQALMEFASQTRHLLPALTAIRWAAPQGDYERLPEFLVAQAAKWQAQYPQHPWVAQLAATADPTKLPVLIGDVIPNFPLPMLNGDTLLLRQMLASRLTLLDLWASWCAPCRKENRNYLVPLWEQYHESGFQIIGYALDAGRQAWTSAIKKDGADRWLHASHLRGDDAPLFKALRISTIPANFLIDHDGRVLAKNLHAEELRAFLDEYFEKK